MRILVCGGRDYKDYRKVCDVLYPLFNKHMDQEQLLIQGGATGADNCAYRFAIEAKLPVRTYMAKWKEYGRAAGIVRNKQMLEEGKPNLVVAFPGGRGTANMVKIAKEAGIRVIEVEK